MSDIHVIAGLRPEQGCAALALVGRGGEWVCTPN